MELVAFISWVDFNLLESLRHPDTNFQGLTSLDPSIETHFQLCRERRFVVFGGSGVDYRPP